jgi:hypothetical protein
MCAPLPLCDAFFARRSFLHRSQRVHPNPLAHEPQIPLCGLRDLCAMLSPLDAVPRTEANVFIQAHSPTNQIPLCGLLN